ncbi:hypothetical protein HHL17_00600 [Chitinophaga sp. G-6-1-13]|uniref:Tetratricopeptide repeat protein n=1 Tax=Chitinophaga fulva TaxID=2728842 RepID=A0A848GDB1_9BACT|nr:hypothetical protein [Chitinophaga fulva]NML35681.1 hypothetical protein [Chitinophaga fulva]
MKRLLLSLFMIGGLATVAVAQSAQYQDAMSKQVSDLDSSGSFAPDALVAKINTFERIAEAEKTQWLPYYYAAYCQVMSCFVGQDKSKIDELADKAAANLDKAETLNPKSSEVACIRSLVASARLMVDPASRGMKYGMEAGQQIELAKTYNAENPRVYLLLGQSLLFTPEQFGGSKSKAKVMLETALQKYAAFKPESAIAPHWGEPYAKELLSKAQ